MNVVLEAIAFSKKLSERMDNQITEITIRVNEIEFIVFSNDLVKLNGFLPKPGFIDLVQPWGTIHIERTTGL